LIMADIDVRSPHTLATSSLGVLLFKVPTAGAVSSRG
jgi:hypothetical protein